MSIRISKSAVRLTAFASLLLATSSGCKHWNIFRDDDGFPKEEQKLTEGVRPTEPNSHPWAVSEKGREVERNFGIGAK